MHSLFGRAMQNTNVTSMILSPNWWLMKAKYPLFVVFAYLCYLFTHLWEQNNQISAFKNNQYDTEWILVTNIS